MSSDCGTTEPKKQSAYLSKCDEVDKALAGLNEMINLLTSTLNPVLVAEPTEGEAEKGCDKAPSAQLEEYLNDVRRSVDGAARKIRRINERCCL